MQDEYKYNFVFDSVAVEFNCTAPDLPAVRFIIILFCLSHLCLVRNSNCKRHSNVARTL